MAEATESYDGYNMLLHLLRHHDQAAESPTELFFHPSMLPRSYDKMNSTLADMWFDSCLDETTELPGPTLGSSQAQDTQLVCQKPEAMGRPYTVDELLSLRKSLPFVICNVGKLKDITSEVVHLPAEIKSGSKLALNMSQMKHSRSNSRLYNSADDDEERIVYRGHPAHRPAREVAWRYLRQHSSDRPSQPLSAPSELAAQKADNFRKFYRAVVSPTHVRVTAGGRIVPNTRAPPQPMFSWNYGTEALNLTDQQTYQKSNDEFDQQAPWLQGVRLDMTDRPLPLRSDYVGVPGVPVFGPSIPPTVVNTGHGSTANQENRAGSVQDSVPTMVKAQREEGQPTSPVEEVTISPPSQFDTSKPFIYNGQLVYPMPQGFQPPTIPFNMLGTISPVQPQLITPGQPSMFFPQQMQFQTSSMANPFPMMSTAQPGSVMNFGGFLPLIMPGGSTQLIQSPQGLVPIGSFLGSPTTEQQVDALQNHVKHLENQLQNNRHQIDEAYVIAQRDMARHQITTLLYQSSMNEQPHQQISRSQRSESNNDGVQVEPSNGTGLQLNPEPLGKPLGTARIIPKKPVALSEPKASFDLSMPSTIRPVEGSNLRSITGPQTSESSVPPKAEIRKRLSAAAAMAPPFLPRSMQPNTEFSGIKSPERELLSVDVNSPVGSKGSQKQDRTQNASVPAVTEWKIPQARQVLKSLPPPTSKAQTTYGTNGSDTFGLPPTALQSFGTHTFSAGIGSNDPSLSHDFDDSVPYLMGFPPSGMTFEKAASDELQYSRKLTEDEQRARHLYWGRAPREALKGLPKFDGRDFYPPSPAKKSAQPAMRTFESEFNSSTGSDALESSQGWCLPSELEEKSAVFRPSSLKEGAKDHDVVNQSGSSQILRRKKTWEKSVDDIGQRATSFDSWVVPGSLDEIYSRSASRPTSLGGNDPSPRRYETTSTPGTMNSKPFRTIRSQSTFLQGMLNSPRASMATVSTGSPSSTTAQGYLPQYRGSAAVALAPSMSSVNASSQGRDNYNPFAEASKTNRANSIASLRAENRPPLVPAHPHRDTTSAADLLRRINRQEKELHHDPGFNANTTGVGPTFSSDW